MSLQGNFLEFIRHQELAEKNILVTVSGGMDSVVMLRLFLEAGIKIGIAHCNFTLRGKESDEDEKFVTSLSEEHRIPLYVRNFDTEKFAAENKLSIQQAARELRYRWFDSLCDELKYDRIATAHHANDSIETFFINLSRGSGIKGLRGIPASNGRVIRPMLASTRLEIEKYASENNIKYREDSSNASDDYLRNRIRHHVIPVIRKNVEGFEEGMQSLMKDLSFFHDILFQNVEEWKKKNIVTEEKNLLIPLKEIQVMAEPVLFLSTVLYTFGIIRMDSSKILSSTMPGKFFYDGEYVLLRDRENLILTKTKSETTGDVIIQGIPAEINFGSFGIKITSENITEGTDTEKKITHRIDSRNLRFPLMIRQWKDGDRFTPLGMKGEKKVSDFFTDIKMDRLEKLKTPLLLSGNDIVCILGHRIGERYKLTPDTQNTLTIELTRQ